MLKFVTKTTAQPASDSSESDMSVSELEEAESNVRVEA